MNAAYHQEHMGKHRSKARRIFTRVMVFLLLGAIVNVAVAWGLAFQLNRAAWTKVDQPDELKAFQVRLRALGTFAPDELPIEAYRKRALGLTWESAYPYSLYAQAGAAWTRVGIPLRSVGGVVFLPDQQVDDTKWEWQVHGAIAISRPGTDEGAILLPHFPLWPGFAINTIFYAAILWMLWAIPGAIIRMRRNQRGLCIHCGYNLRGAPADSVNCPECGRPPQQRLKSERVSR